MDKNFPEEKMEEVKSLAEINNIADVLGYLCCSCFITIDDFCGNEMGQTEALALFKKTAKTGCAGRKDVLLY